MKYQLDQKYSPRERPVVLFLIQNREATIDQLRDAIEKETGTAVTKKNATRVIWAAAAKLAKDKFILTRKTKLGRGHKGEYILTSMNEKD